MSKISKTSKATLSSSTVCKQQQKLEIIIYHNENSIYRHVFSLLTGRMLRSGINHRGCGDKADTRTKPQRSPQAQYSSAVQTRTFSSALRTSPLYTLITAHHRNLLTLTLTLDTLLKLTDHLGRHSKGLPFTRVCTSPVVVKKGGRLSAGRELLEKRDFKLGDGTIWGKIIG